MPAARSIGVVGFAALAGALAAGCSGEGDAGPHAATVAVNCLDCHNSVDRVADLDLESLDFAAVGSQAETWEKVVR